MKLSCTQEKLNKGINIVSRIVSPRGTLPVLNNILIKTDNGRLKISATDLEIGINTWIGAKVDSEGGITIPSRLISDYVSTNNDETINLELKDTTLNLKSDKYEAHIKGIDASEFPLIPEVKKESIVSVKSKNFKELVNQVVFSAALDETRPILTGIFLSIKDDMLKLVATDSYRLAEKKYNLDKKISEELNVIIPQRTMHELARILADNEENVDIKIGENQIQFGFGDTQLISRLIEGTYIDYTQIIPKKYETRAEIKLNELATAIKMASLFARESANNIKLKISKDKVDVIAVSPQVGDNVSKVNAVTEGNDIEIAFNAKFILDGLSVIKEEKVYLEIIDKMSAGVLKPVKDKNYIYLIMPLRVEE